MTMIRCDEVQMGESGIAKLRFAIADIKLLRVSLVAEGVSVTDGLGAEWIGAQPNQNLSPANAARALIVASWSLPSRVKERYRKLLLRFPPEQFPQKHMDWRPAEELLGTPIHRLNWYWQSGHVPGFEIADDLSPESQEWLRSSWQHAGTCGSMTRRLCKLISSKNSSLGTCG
jgi:hypothetical protein